MENYLFLLPDHVPLRWRERVVQVAMVPLLPDEAAQVLGGEEARPEVAPEEEPLLRLAARGQSVERIAGELGLSSRSVRRHLAELRDRFDVETNAELALFLATRGF